MRESRTYASVRGALSNGCPYRVQRLLRLLTPGSGTSRTSRDVRLESAKWALAARPGAGSNPARLFVRGYQGQRSGFSGKTPIRPLPAFACVNPRQDS